MSEGTRIPVALIGAGNWGKNLCRTLGAIPEMLQTGPFDDRQAQSHLHRPILFGNVHQSYVGAVQCQS